MVQPEGCLFYFHPKYASEEVNNVCCNGIKTSNFFSSDRCYFKYALNYEILGGVYRSRLSTLLLL